MTNFRTAPAIGYTLLGPSDTRTPTHTNVYHGLQPSGRYLNLIDLDSHTAGQDANAARAAFEQQFPNLGKINWHRSQGGHGWHGYVLSNKPLPHGKLYHAGQHIGELLSNDDSRSIMPAGLAPGWLSRTEYDLILQFWAVDAPSGGDRWTDRKREGLRYVAGHNRHHVTKDMLRAVLRTHCGTVGAHLDRLFDVRTPFDRSNATGNLAQTLMLNIHKIAPMAGYSERCALVMAYLMASDAYGKADDKDYNPEGDGASLIAQIVNGDPYANGTKRWTIPFWAKAHPTPIAAPSVHTVAPTRPAHRPAGDQARQLRKFRRRLAEWALDSVGKIYYYVDDLAEYLKVSRRTAQNYLHILETDQLIERGQDGGAGGRAWLTLTPLFWGANNSEKATEKAENSTPFWGANAIAEQRVPTPRNVDPTPVCIEDHQDPSAPALAGPSPAGAQGFGDLPSGPQAAAEASYNPKADQTRKRRRRSKLSPKETAARDKTRRRAKWRSLAETDIPLLEVERWKLSRKAAKVRSAPQRDRLMEYVAEIDYYLARKGSHQSEYVPMPEADLPDLSQRQGAAQEAQ